MATPKKVSMAMVPRKPGAQVRSRAVGLIVPVVGVDHVPPFDILGTNPIPKRCWTIAENEERFHRQGPSTYCAKATTNGLTNCQVGNNSKSPNQAGSKHPEAIGARETAMIERTDGQCRRWSNAFKLVYPRPTKLI